MSNADFSFDADTEEVEDGFDCLPEHSATFIVEKSEWLDLKSGDGERLNLQIKEVQGPHKGRIVFMSYNLIHPKEKTVNIAKSQIKPLLFACGHMQITKTNTSVLHNKPFLAKCIVRPGNAQYPDPSNELRNITNMNGDKPAKKGQAATQPAQTQAQVAQDEPPSVEEGDNWFDE